MQTRATIAYTIPSWNVRTLTQEMLCRQIKKTLSRHTRRLTLATLRETQFVVTFYRDARTSHSRHSYHSPIAQARVFLGCAVVSLMLCSNYSATRT
jgi:hypothetical protein